MFAEFVTFLAHALNVILIILREKEFCGTSVCGTGKLVLTTELKT